jgi:hypothetical protein
MALVCNKVSKIANFFRNTLKSKLNTYKSANEKFEIFNPFQSESKPLLSDYLHYYTNFQKCKLDNEIELEQILIKEISSSLEAKENYGSDAIVTSLKSKNKAFY